MQPLPASLLHATSYLDRGKVHRFAAADEAELFQAPVPPVEPLHIQTGLLGVRLQAQAPGTAGLDMHQPFALGLGQCAFQ